MPKLGLNKGEPASAKQEIWPKKMNVIAAVSWSGYLYVTVSELNTTRSIFCIFLKNLIQHLKLKYEEYFAKIILTYDGIRYH